ncbi:hypothetical protein S40285_00285 [Stachybotrys chlorohalonatus IBT 40285]|uniref:Myb-like domain-containing protein n=1 Tax=Stachybotrys chlorohalonatus (strain IBT 40285) TaxID=1283841 RepID=A0A084QHM3_STAC4|nr:hypothetical protein S40285_00285 [Stachybotrys chlorohalonata IBT 40285]
MYLNHVPSEQIRPLPFRSIRANIKPGTEAEKLPSLKDVHQLHIALSTRPTPYPHTPPESASGSPTMQFEVSPQYSSCNLSPPAIITRQSNNNPPVKLPSFAELEGELEDMVRRAGRASTPVQTITSPLGRFRHSIHPQPHLVNHVFGPPDGYHSPPSSDYSSHSSYSPYGNYAQGGLEGYPSPPSDGENRHINQKYTTEEGDFIIYAWHDKKLKWQRIKQDFAAMFGRTPERTVQGLQAWYYRMNQRIPLWDKDGWLCFENEDDLEPKSVSIKCRERDSQDKPMEPLGLAQRYPERAMRYSWVDPDLKRKAQDWASKREMQFRERRERRKRKEQRRLKL